MCSASLHSRTDTCMYISSETTRSLDMWKQLVLTFFFESPHHFFSFHSTSVAAALCYLLSPNHHAGVINHEFNTDGTSLCVCVRACVSRNNLSMLSLRTIASLMKKLRDSPISGLSTLLLLLHFLSSPMKKHSETLSSFINGSQICSRAPFHLVIELCPVRSSGAHVVGHTVQTRVGGVALRYKSSKYQWEFPKITRRIFFKKKCSQLRKSL